MQGSLPHANWLDDFPVGGPFLKVCFREKYVRINDYVHNHTHICTALLMKSLFQHSHRDNMVLVSANSLWILDLWDTSHHHLSELSCTPDNIHIWTASTVSTTRDNTLKLSHLLATSSTLSSSYTQFSLTYHRTDRVIFLATLTKNLWNEPSLLNNSILPTQSDHLLGIEQC